MRAAPSMRTALRATLSLVVLAGCGGDKSVGPRHPGPVARVVITAGDAQRGPAGAQLPQALSVRAVDADGTPVPGQSLNFVVTSGGGSVFAGANVSNSAGIAQERWTLGPSATEPQRVEVRAVDNTTGAPVVFATFTATATAGAPASLLIEAGATQTVPAGTPVVVLPRVRVSDQFGNPVPGATVTFAVVSGGGTVTGATATTDAGGSAAVGGWTLGPAVSTPNVLTATVNGVSATFSAIATSPVRLTIESPAPFTSVGDSFTTTVSATTLAAAGSIASVSATVDGRTTPLVRGAGTTWSAPISMAGSTTDGSRLVTVTVKDAAGNSATAAVNIVYALPLPTIPSSQSYVQLQSDPGDYVGAGRNYTYTRANATLAVSVTGGHVAVSVGGNQSWNGDFVTPSAVSQLQPGIYTGLTRYPFHDPANGGLSWFGDGRGCNTLTGFFAVDSVTYSGTTLATLHLRFEQHCDGSGPALRGTVHWRAEDTTSPPGPASIPSGLWQPPAGALPGSGNYTYLQSDAGDYIGGGATTLYTPPSSPMSVSASGRTLSIAVGGWNATFQAMNSVTRIEPGYYAGLLRYPFHSASTGGFDWSGNGRGCNTLQAWVAVDRVTYVGGVLTAIDLRFEQHCEGGTPALRGAVHWSAG